VEHISKGAHHASVGQDLDGEEHIEVVRGTSFRNLPDRPGSTVLEMLLAEK
jgi:hypothetical protein